MRGRRIWSRMVSAVDDIGARWRDSEPGEKQIDRQGRWQWRLAYRERQDSRQTETEPRDDDGGRRPSTCWLTTGQPGRRGRDNKLHDPGLGNRSGWRAAAIASNPSATRGPGRTTRSEVSVTIRPC